MIVDASALVAILQRDPSAHALTTVLADADHAAISAATLTEAGVVADSVGDPIRTARFDALIEALDLEVVAVSAAHARLARQAYRDYGRGSGHPARLDFGDCFSYALARERREPLLFVGGGFARTDLRNALTASTNDATAAEPAPSAATAAESADAASVADPEADAATVAEPVSDATVSLDR